MAPDSFKVCSICRNPIAFGAKYYLCSVSTCRTNRTGLFFCSLPCFEAHVPELRHRDAWAEEERAPTREQAARDAANAAAPSNGPGGSSGGGSPGAARSSGGASSSGAGAANRAVQPNRTYVANASPAAPPLRATDDAARRRIVGQPEPPRADSAEDDKEVLVVVSKLKKFIRDRSGMNTSDTAIPVLSDHLRWLSVEALRKAAEDGRKTVMDRDYEAVIRAFRKPGEH